MESSIHVYGADWCGLTFRLREYLMRARLSYDYHNVEREPRAAEFVQSIKGSTPRFPVVVVEDTVATCPTVDALQRLIDDYGLQPTASRSRRFATLDSDSAP